MKYFHQPREGKTIYFRRGIPQELRHAFEGKPYYVRSTGTSNPVQATRELEKINKQYEQDIARAKIKGDSGVTLSAIRKSFESFGLDVRGQGSARDRELLSDIYLDEKLYTTNPRIYHTGSEDEIDELVEKALTPVEQRMHEILSVGLKLKVTEYVEPYLELKGKADNKKFKNDLNSAVKFFVDALGNDCPENYSRTDLNKLIKYGLSKVKTSTIHKRLGLLRAMFNKVKLEYEIEGDHPFHNWDIPSFGEDKTEREDFSHEELNTIVKKIKPDTDIGRIILIMLNTGMRVNEVLGLRREDISLDNDYPYLKLQKNPFRRLKTKNSKRIIPLVGEAYEAVKEAVGSSEWLFEHYLDRAQNKFKNDSVSNAVNKRLRTLLGDDSPSAHSFRHSMNTLLRNVDCPKDVREELLGWRSSVSDMYGSPTDIAKKSNYLRDAIALYM